MVEKDELAEAKEFLTHLESDMRHQVLDIRGEMLAKKAHRLITNYVELLEKKDPYQEYYVMDDQGNLIRKS